MCLTVDRDGVLWAGTMAGLARQTGNGAFTVVDGVPRVAIFSILQDPDGMLWLDSEHGLMRRYEGRWQTVLSSPRSTWGSRLAVDRQGQLWYGAHASARLYRFTAHERRAPLPVDAELIELPRPVIALFVDREDNLWLGTQSMGLWSLKRQPVTRWSTQHGLAYPEIRAVTADGEGGLWIASDCDMQLTRWRCGSAPTAAGSPDCATVSSPASP